MLCDAITCSNDSAGPVALLRAGFFFAAGTEDGAEDLALRAVTMCLKELDVAVNEDALAFLESVMWLLAIDSKGKTPRLESIETHLPQFRGSTKVPGLSQTKGLQTLPFLLPLMLDGGLEPPLVTKSESRQGSEHAQGCTQAIWLGQ